MRQLIPLRLKTLRTTARAAVRHAAFGALLAVTLFAMRGLVAQEPMTGKPATHHSSKTAKSAAKGARDRKAAEVPAQQPAVAVADTPPAPVWPVNEKARPAHINWDSHGLKIEATNSSLDQILREVSTVTGVKVEGFSKDQRIFGTYGPGPAREVLSRLLDGSEYNVLIVGGVGDAPPSRIVLSMANPSGPPPPRGIQNQQNEDDAEAEEPQQQEQPMPQPPQVPQETPQPVPLRNPFGDNPRVPMPMGPQQVPMPPNQQQPQNNQPQNNPPQYNFPQYNPQQ